jgi:RNA polymerase sigma factor (sigma-70 family)
MKKNGQTQKKEMESINKVTSNRREAMDLAMQIENLFKTDRKKFLGFIRQRVRSQEEAEDILQDVFTNVLAASANVQKPIENIASWVFTAVRNRIIDSYRKKRAETFSDMQTPGQAEDGVDSFENFLGDSVNTPETDLVRKTIWESVQAGLAELPDEQRDVFVKNEFEGVSFREMSEETGVNINTLLARKRYAVLHLRKRLKHLYSSINEN